MLDFIGLYCWFSVYKTFEWHAHILVLFAWSAWIHIKLCIDIKYNIVLLLNTWGNKIKYPSKTLILLTSFSCKSFKGDSDTVELSNFKIRKIVYLIFVHSDIQWWSASAVIALKSVMCFFLNSFSLYPRESLETILWRQKTPTADVLNQWKLHLNLVKRLLTFLQ